MVSVLVIFRPFLCVCCQKAVIHDIKNNALSTGLIGPFVVELSQCS